MSLKKLASQIKKEKREQEKTIEERFIEAIDEFMTAPPTEVRKKRLAFNPSSYYKCMRAKWYELKEVPATDGKVYARSQRILGVGTALHEWIQGILMEMDRSGAGIKLIPIEEIPAYGKEGFEVIREHKSSPMEIKFLDYRFTEIFPISAMVDGALDFNNKHMLFEFKTINPSDFEFLFEPLIDHIKQGAIYALCTGVRQVMFLYMCKGTQNFKAFFVQYTDEQMEWVVNRCRTIEEYYKADELPPKEESDQCKWCAYKSLCQKDQKGVEKVAETSAV